MAVSRSRMRRLAVVGALLAAGLAAAALLAWRERLALAERALLAALAARGAEPASLRVVRAGPEGLVLEDLVLGDPPDLRVERLEVDVAWPGLLAGRLERAHAEGAELRGRVGPEGLDLGAAQGVLLGEPAAADGAALAPLALPARRVALRNAAAELETPFGPVRVEGGMDGREAPDGRLAVTAHGRARHAWGEVEASAGALGPPDALEAGVALRARPGEALPFTLEAPWVLSGTVSAAPDAPRLVLRAAPVALRGRVLEREIAGRLPALAVEAEAPAGGALRVGLGAAGGALRDPATALGARLDAFRLALAGEALRGHAALAVEDGADAARLAPLGVELALSGTRLAPEAALTLRGPEGSVRAEATAALELPADGEEGWRLRADLAPLALATLAPATLLPALGEALGEGAETTGTVEAHLRATGGAGDPAHSQLDLGLRDVTVRSELASVEGLQGGLRLVGPPWRTPAPELLAMRRLDVGIPLDDGLVQLLLHPEGRVEIREATWHFADGRVRAGASFQLPGALEHAVLLVEGLDVAALVERLDVAGLEGTGRLSGALPVFVEGERLEVRGGILQSDGEGVVRWHPPQRAALAGRPGMGVLLDALEDFHYERVVLTLEGDLRGAVDVGLDLRGANPNLQGGRPVELHVNVDARLADLVRAGSAAYRVPERIEERMRELSTGRDR